jgi:small subunit ribosomal protein S20
MPHTRSAKKNDRKSLKRKLRNRRAMTDIKLQLKAFNAALKGPLEELKKQYNLSAKILDKAAARRIIHPNLAARKKSQLARAITAKQSPPPPAPAKK